MNKERKLTTPKSLLATILTPGFPPLSITFQTFTILSIPPVAIHPRMWGEISSADAAPSCADRVYRAGEGELRSVGRVRASKFRTRPFSNDTYIMN